MAFTLRLSDSELAEIDRAAQAQGVPRALFVRQASLAAARLLRRLQHWLRRLTN